MHSIEKHFFLILTLALASGLFLPQAGDMLVPAIKPLLMMILLLTSLKIDFKSIFSYLKKPLRSTYIFVLIMLIIPTIVFLITNQIDQTLAIGLLLMTATPPAMASPVLTEIFKGNSALSLTTLITCSLLSPLTMPFLFKILTSQSIELDSLEMAKTLAIMIFTPIILAEIIKKIQSAKPTIEKVKKYVSGINIIIMSILGYIGIAIQSDTLLNNPLSIIKQLIALTILFAVMHVIGYMIGFWRPREDKIAIATSNTYMNSSLAFVIAVEFFPPEIVLISIVSQLTWNLFPGIFKQILRIVR
ncbi:MAG: Bile acid:sodium symporter family protein [Candidatus Peregrinibacteria bacterium GW2011_GWA2_43_8]|nr:MAG: Bile acid:sodium symporter family protein [Candidatus Peregrinibacteria bacterium GW2011_GWA2_43_8]